MQIIYSYQSKSKTYDMQKESILIGRPTAEGEMPDLDLTPDAKVSRRHARIWRDENHYWIEDTNSSRGTFVNGEDIRTTGKVRLTSEMRVRVGETELRLLPALSNPLPKLRLSVQYQPTINYSLLYSGVPFFREITLWNDDVAASASVTLQLELAGYAEPLAIPIPGIPAGGSHQVHPLPPLYLKRQKFLDLAEPIKTTLTARLDGESISFPSPMEVRVLPPNAWHAVAHDEALAGFVMPHSDAVEEVIQHARLFLRRLLRGVNSFADALTSSDANSRQKMAQAIYDCLQEKYSIHYEFERRTYEEDWQMVRFHYEVLGRLAGTCIDLALLFAACLENVHLNPMIILIQPEPNTQHALLGIRTNEDELAEAVIYDEQQISQWVQTGDLILLDSVGFAYGREAEQTFTECRASGQELYQQCSFVYALDIVTARTIHHIAPLPFGTGIQFDRPAWIAIFRARQEAERQHHKFVGVRHLFLALLSLEEGVLRQVLNHFGPGTADTIASEIQRSLGRGAARPVSGTIPETDDLKSVLNHAKQQAKNDEQLMVTEAQLLRALLEFPGQIETLLGRAGLNSQSCLEQLNNIAPNNGIPSGVASEMQSDTDNQTDIS